MHDARMQSIADLRARIKAIEAGSDTNGRSGTHPRQCEGNPLCPTSWSVGKMLSAKSSKSQCLGLLGVRWLAVLKTMGDSSNGRSNRMQIAIKQIRHLRRSSDCCASVNMLAPCCISGCCQAAMTTVSLPRLCNGQSTAACER